MHLSPLRNFLFDFFNNILNALNYVQAVKYLAF
jgi:hypothetical protein